MAAPIIGGNTIGELTRNAIGYENDQARQNLALRELIMRQRQLDADRAQRMHEFSNLGASQRQYGELEKSRQGLLGTDIANRLTMEQLRQANIGRGIDNELTLGKERNALTGAELANRLAIEQLRQGNIGRGIDNDFILGYDRNQLLGTYYGNQRLSDQERNAILQGQNDNALYGYLANSMAALQARTQPTDRERQLILQENSDRSVAAKAANDEYPNRITSLRKTPTPEEKAQLAEMVKGGVTHEAALSQLAAQQLGVSNNTIKFDPTVKRFAPVPYQWQPPDLDKNMQIIVGALPQAMQDRIKALGLFPNNLTPGAAAPAPAGPQVNFRRNPDGTWSTGAPVARQPRTGAPGRPGPTPAPGPGGALLQGAEDLPDESGVVPSAPAVVPGGGGAAVAPASVSDDPTERAVQWAMETKGLSREAAGDYVLAELRHRKPDVPDILDSARRWYGQYYPWAMPRERPAVAGPPIPPGFQRPSGTPDVLGPPVPGGFQQPGNELLGPPVPGQTQSPRGTPPPQPWLYGQPQPTGRTTTPPSGPEPWNRNQFLDAWGGISGLPQMSDLNQGGSQLMQFGDPWGQRSQYMNELLSPQSQIPQQSRGFDWSSSIVQPRTNTSLPHDAGLQSMGPLQPQQQQQQAPPDAWGQRSNYMNELMAPQREIDVPDAPTAVNRGLDVLRSLYRFQ